MMSEEVNNVEVHPVTESLAEDWVHTRQEYSDEAARPNKRKRSVQFKLFGADIVGEKTEDDDYEEVPTEAGCLFFLNLMRRKEDDDDYKCSGQLPKRFKHLKLFGEDIHCESEVDGDQKPIMTQVDGFIFDTQDLLSNAIPTSSCSSNEKSNGVLDLDLNFSDGFWDALVQ